MKTSPRTHMVGGLLLIAAGVVIAVLGLATPYLARSVFGYTGSRGLDWTSVVLVAAAAMAVLLFIVGVIDGIIGVIGAGVQAGTNLNQSEVKSEH